MSSQPGFIYLTWGQDPATSLIILWQTKSADNPKKVDYRPAGTDTWQHATGSSTDSPGAGVIHQVYLKGLLPGTVYEYRVSWDDGSMSEAHNTRTAQSGAFDYRFIYFTDTGLIGRPDGFTNGTEQVRGEILHDNPLFLLGGGDYAYGNKDGRFEVMAEAGDEWFRQWQPVLTRFPFYPQYGNHEIFLKETFEDWGPRFAYPKDHEDGRYYSFDVGDVHYTAIFAPESKTMPTPEQLAWLDADLAAARARGTRWLITFQHAPIYGCGISHAATPEMRALFVPIYEKHAVDLVITGHDQSYERTFPLHHDGETPNIMSSSMDTYRQGEGVIYTKVSPSGKRSEISRDFSKFTIDQQPFMAVRDDTAHHYAYVDVDASGKLEYVAFSVRGDGSPKTMLDHFTITAKDG